jgi:hypothetical protein
MHDFAGTQENQEQFVCVNNSVNIPIRGFIVSTLQRVQAYELFDKKYH